MAKDGRVVDGEWRPTGFHKKHGGYYLVRQNKWLSLGRDYRQALLAYYRHSQSDERPQNIRHLLTLYIESRRALKRSPHTISDYQKWGDRLAAVFGHLPAEMLTRTHVEKYIDTQSAAKAGLRQLRGEVHLLRSIYRWAIKTHPEWGISVSPADQLESGRVPSPPDRTHLPTCDDLAVFWAFAPPKLKSYIDLKILLSSRQEDILALRLHDITESGLRVAIQKTGGGQIHVITPALDAALKDALKLPRKGDYLFETRLGKPYVATDADSGYHVVSSGWSTMWQRTKQIVRAQVAWFIPFLDVDIRALVAQRAHRAGGIEAARRQLGHLNHQTTDRYLRQRGIEVVEPLE